MERFEPLWHGGLGSLRSPVLRGAGYLGYEVWSFWVLCFSFFVKWGMFVLGHPNPLKHDTFSKMIKLTQNDNTHSEKLPETYFPKNSPAFVESFPWKIRRRTDLTWKPSISFWASIQFLEFVFCIVLDELYSYPPSPKLTLKIGRKGWSLKHYYRSHNPIYDWLLCPPCIATKNWDYRLYMHIHIYIYIYMHLSTPRWLWAPWFRKLERSPWACRKWRKVDHEKGTICKPIGSMYAIVTYIYHKDQPNVGTITIPYMDPMGKGTVIVSSKHLDFLRGHRGYVSLCGGCNVKYY